MGRPSRTLQRMNENFDQIDREQVSDTRRALVMRSGTPLTALGTMGRASARSGGEEADDPTRQRFLASSCPDPLPLTVRWVLDGIGSDAVVARLGCRVQERPNCAPRPCRRTGCAERASPGPVRTADAL